MRAPTLLSSRKKGTCTIYYLQLALKAFVGLSLVGLSRVCLLNVVSDHFSIVSGVCSASIGTLPVHHTHPWQTGIQEQRRQSFCSSR